MANSLIYFVMIADEQCGGDYDDMKWKMKACDQIIPAFVYPGNASPFSLVSCIRPAHIMLKIFSKFE